MARSRDARGCEAGDGGALRGPGQDPPALPPRLYPPGPAAAREELLLWERGMLKH